MKFGDDAIEEGRLGGLLRIIGFERCKNRCRFLKCEKVVLRLLEEKWKSCCD